MNGPFKIGTLVALKCVTTGDIVELALITSDVYAACNYIGDTWHQHCLSMLLNSTPRKPRYAILDPDRIADAFFRLEVVSAA